MTYFESIAAGSTLVHLTRLMLCTMQSMLSQLVHDLFVGLSVCLSTAGTVKTYARFLFVYICRPSVRLRPCGKSSSPCTAVKAL